MTVRGSELRVGDTISVWWRGHRDTITALRPYDGVYKNEPAWAGCRVAEFAICVTGMTIFAHEVYEVLHRAEE